MKKVVGCLRALIFLVYMVILVTFAKKSCAPNLDGMSGLGMLHSRYCDKISLKPEQRCPNSHFTQKSTTYIYLLLSLIPILLFYLFNEI